MRVYVLLLALLAVSAFAAFAPVEHPFILWTKADVARMKAKLETEDGKQQLALSLKENTTFANLLRYQVLGDKKAGEAERNYLLGIIGTKVDALRAPLDQGGRHLDNYLDALRYDVLYDMLTPVQRLQIEATFRNHVQYCFDKPYVNNKLSWLPNMQMPYILSAHMMALALQDEALIRKTWAIPSGFTFYFNDYLSDGGLYNEEFAKMWSIIGEFLILSRGLDRLGLGELGFDYVGKGGASVRGYVESRIWFAYPRVDLPGGMPAYPVVSMGDTRGGSLLQHTNLPGGANEVKLWYSANMNGRDHKGTKVTKLGLPQWFEILAARYPDGPFPYCLAQMRAPGQDRYMPTIFWGLDPIDPTKVTPPPAPSRVFPERGFAMIRMDESAAYWESPAPAVSLQFATLYVHYTSDCFSLLGYQAFNRPIYVNRAISAGYNGGPWDFHVRGHCGVVVDGLQAQPIGEVPTRQEFAPLVKFVAADGRMRYPDKPYKGRGEVRSSDQPREPATQIYPGVDLSRALLLTREYLFDAYQLSSETPRRYDWLVHAPGIATPDDGKGWGPSDDLRTTLMSAPTQVTDPATKQPVTVNWLSFTGERKLDPGADAWRLRTTQVCLAPDPAKTQFGQAWYDRKVGVRVWMLGEPGTTAHTFDTPTNYTPGTQRSPGAHSPVPEFGGVSLAVTRTAARTAFIAVHEPFEQASPILTDVRRVAQTDDAVAAAILGAGVNDRVLYRWGDKAAEPLTLAGDGESFTFADHAFLRITADTVEVVGDLRALMLKVAGTPKLMLNGKEAKATVQGGVMAFGN